MKYCSHCGNQLLDEAIICPNCGCPAQSQNSVEPDKISTGLNVLSFFFPIIGLILYILWHEKTPLKAKAIGKWAIIGFIVNFLLLALI